MEIWFENIRNPTVNTLMNNLDNHFWVDYLHNLTDNISQEGLVQDYDTYYDLIKEVFLESNDDYMIMNPFFFFMRRFALDKDKERYGLYTPHLSWKVRTQVFLTIALVIGHITETCIRLTQKMDCDDKCTTYDPYIEFPKTEINFHNFYKVPKQDSDPNYWLYFEEAVLHDVCWINYTSEVKCKLKKSQHNRILSDNAIWDNFAAKTFFDENFERDKKRSASKLVYSMCHNCQLACKTDYRRIGRFKNIMHEVLCLLSQGISALLLISACAVYSMTPKLRRNINGKSTSCHLIALTVTAFFLFIDRIMNFTHYTTTDNDNRIDNRNAVEKNTTNKITGLVIWYSTLSAFFWLNSICLDTFIAFWRGRRFFIKESSRLKIYMVFSWGLPLVITLIIFIVTWNKPKLERQNFYSRVFSSWKKRGWVRGGVLIRWLWDVPITISLLLNLLIFSATALVLYQHSRKIKILGGGNSGCSNRVNLSRASIYLRLFSLVGTHWVLQMYGWKQKNLFPYIQIIGNFQGSITFLMLICRKSTIKAFKTRHNDKQNLGKLDKIEK